MNYNKHIFAILIFSNILAEASQTQLHRKAMHGPDHLELHHTDGEGFYVIDEGNKRRVPHHRLEDILGKMNHATLRAFLDQDGYIRVKKLGSNDYKLTPYTRGLGGGPVLASIFYSGTKAICYGGAIGAATAAVVATGGGAAPAMAVGAAAEVVGAGAAGAGVVAAGVASSATATAVATTATTGAVVASAGTTGGIVGLIEGLAIAAGAAGAAIPWI